MGRLQLFVTVSAEEKQVILAAAAKMGFTMSGYLARAAMERARRDLKGSKRFVLPPLRKPKSLCGHCSREIMSWNTWHYCRKCIRTFGLDALRKMHPEVRSRDKRYKKEK